MYCNGNESYCAQVSELECQASVRKEWELVLPGCAEIAEEGGPGLFKVYPDSSLCPPPTWPSDFPTGCLGGQRSIVMHRCISCLLGQFPPGCCSVEDPSGRIIIPTPPSGTALLSPPLHPPCSPLFCACASVSPQPVMSHPLLSVSYFHVSFLIWLEASKGRVCV